MHDRDLLMQGARSLGLELDTAQVDKFFIYLNELQRWNKKINLTSITDDREIVIRHFLDSLVLCASVRDGDRLLDMGAGGGFPGLVLSIAKKSLNVTLMDAVNKKVTFMRSIIRGLKLENANAIAARVEDDKVIEVYKGAFDIVVSRAFSSLEFFLTVSLPYIRPGGRIIAVKGPKKDPQLDPTSDALLKEKFKGLRCTNIEEISVPYSTRKTTLLTFSVS